MALAKGMSSINVETDTVRHLAQLRKATGMTQYTIVALALAEWEQRHCHGKTLAGQKLKEMRKGDKK